MSIQVRLERDKELIFDRIHNGDSTSLIAKQYGCNPGTIWFFLDKYNIKPSRQRTDKYGNSELFKDNIINLLNKGYSAYKIGKELNIPKCTILRWLKSWGYDLSSKRKDNPNNRLKDKFDIVKTMFENGQSCSQIGQELGYSVVSVMQLLNKHGYDTSDWKYSVDETFFQNIDSEHKAYVLGWMYSDGNVMLDGRWRISISIKDEEILHKIKDIVKYNGPLYYKKATPTKGGMVELCVNRKCMVDDLIKLGCVPNKSLLLTCPSYEQVPEHLFHHFVRGVFDGDGSSTSKSIFICGSYDFTHQLAEILPCEITGIYQRNKDRDIRKSAYQLCIGRQEQIKKFNEWLYKDASLWLGRKRKEFLTTEETC